MLHQDEGAIRKSIPDAREISRDPRDFPRAKPEGNLSGRGKSRGRMGWISHSLIISREGLILTLSILPCLHSEGFPDPLPVERLMMRECSYSAKTPGGIGKSIPSALKISVLGKSLGSQEISRPSGIDFPIPPSFLWSTYTMSST